MKFLLLTLTLTVFGCSTLTFPGVHRISVQQGNVITEMMIDKLKPGMTKVQARYILGNPVIDDSLDKDRWDYVYTTQISGGDIQRKFLILHFIGNRLSFFETNLSPSDKD